MKAGLGDEKTIGRRIYIYFPLVSKLIFDKRGQIFGFKKLRTEGLAAELLFRNIQLLDEAHYLFHIWSFITDEEAVGFLIGIKASPG